MTAAPARRAIVLAPGSADGIIDALQEAMPDLAVRRLSEREVSMEAARADVLLLYDAADAPHWSEVGDVAGLMRTVVITERPSQADALLAIERGVDGYLEAGLPGSALRRALAGVFGGELAYKRETIGAWLRTRRPSTRQPVLTHRQAQILELIAEGATDKEIAARIGIRTATAQKHVARLLRRLNVRNRAAAVASRRLRSGRSKA